MHLPALLLVEVTVAIGVEVLQHASVMLFRPLLVDRALSLPTQPLAILAIPAALVSLLHLTPARLARFPCGLPLPFAQTTVAIDIEPSQDAFTHRFAVLAHLAVGAVLLGASLRADARLWLLRLSVRLLGTCLRPGGGVLREKLGTSGGAQE